MIWANVCGKIMAGVGGQFASILVTQCYAKHNKNKHEAESLLSIIYLIANFTTFCSIFIYLQL